MLSDRGLLNRRTAGPRGAGRRIRLARVSLLACAATSALVFGAGFGSAAGKASPPVRTVNLGAGPMKVGGKPLKIAYLDVCAACNAWSVSNTKAAVDTAKKLGVKLTVYDAGFDALKQVNQTKTALSQGYNGMVILALSPEMCTIAKQAIKQGVLVSIVNQHVCTSVYATGNSIWFPGAVNFIGGDQTQDIFTKFLTTIAKQNPGPQEVGLVEGTPGLAQSLLASKAVSTVQAKYPQFKVTVIQDPTYDITGAYNKVQTFLPAHPHLSILATVYSDMTQGAAKALQQAGRKNVKVYDMGGSKWAFSAVRDGSVKLTSVFLPATEGVDSVQSLYNTWYKGQPGPHYVDILKSVPDPFVTKQNIGHRTAQY